MSPLRARPTPHDAALVTALALWGLALVVCGVLVALDPHERSVTWSLHTATGDWWARRDIYRGHSGMNYLPQFVLVFSPFHAIPDRAVADIAWRLAGTATLVLGLVLLARSLAGERWRVPFFWMTLLAIWACLPSMRNGQPNLQFSSLQVLAAAMVLRQRWWAAAVCLAAATAVKPLGVAMLGLAPFVYPALWRPVITCTLIMLGLPLLAAPPAYAAGQYLLLIDNFRDASAVTEHRFADVHGIVRTLGLEMSWPLSLAIRPLAGLAFLAIWIAGGRRCGEPLRALLLLSLASGYLMLFNPMTEANGYCIVAPAMAAVSVFLSDFDGRRGLGTAIAVIVLSIGVLPEPLRHWFPRFSLWWHPTVTAVFLALLLVRVFARGDRAAESPAAAPA